MYKVVVARKRAFSVSHCMNKHSYVALRAFAARITPTAPKAAAKAA